jgi:hypothetical protein
MLYQLSYSRLKAISANPRMGIFHDSDTYLPSVNKIVFFMKGLFWELNPGPLAPKARIIPLDQTADDTAF